MATAPPQAGDDVDSYCSKCKLVLAHVVIAVKSTARGTRPAKVECKTCKAVHAYKKEAPTPRKGGRRATGKTDEAARRAEYERLMEGRDISMAAKYKLSQSFTEEDVMDHKTFGVGLVIRVLSDKKIEVRFPTATKILVHDR